MNYDESTKDAVINPQYYKGTVADLEYFDLCEHLLLRFKDPIVAHGYGLLLKYLLRFGAKDDPLQDASKIAWYAERVREYLERAAKGETPRDPYYKTKALAKEQE